MRITKVTTRTGDKGKTGLATGEKVFKSDKIISALGDVDELSSIIGVCVNSCSDSETIKFLNKIQNNLFDIGGQISLNSFWIRFEISAQTSVLKACRVCR